MRLGVSACLGASLVLIACASPPAGGIFTSSASYDAVYAACIAAAADIGYGVTSGNPMSGFISASQAVFSGQGTAVTLSVSVRNANGTVQVEADFVRPPGTVSLGDFGALFDKYVAAVKRRVPDANVTLRKS
jgi:hypothetical protein